MSYIELIKAEIERLITYHDNLANEAAEKGLNNTMEANDLLVRQYKNFLAFINSLPEETCKDSLQVPETCKENTDSFTDKPKEMSVDEAMKYIDEKIAKTRASKSWEGVDVDKFLDEIRGREPDDLEEAAKFYAKDIIPGSSKEYINHVEYDAFIAGAKWMESQMPMPEDTVIFMKGVAEGRRLEREDRNDDNLPRYYGD